MIDELPKGFQLEGMEADFCENIHHDGGKHQALNHLVEEVVPIEWGGSWQQRAAFDHEVGESQQCHDGEDQSWCDEGRHKWEIEHCPGDHEDNGGWHQVVLSILVQVTAHRNAQQAPAFDQFTICFLV